MQPENQPHTGKKKKTTCRNNEYSIVKTQQAASQPFISILFLGRGASAPRGNHNTRFATFFTKKELHIRFAAFFFTQELYTPVSHKKSYIYVLPLFFSHKSYISHKKSCIYFLPLFFCHTKKSYYIPGIRFTTFFYSHKKSYISHKKSYIYVLPPIFSHKKSYVSHIKSYIYVLPPFFSHKKSYVSHKKSYIYICFATLFFHSKRAIYYTV